MEYSYGGRPPSRLMPRSGSTPNTSLTCCLAKATHPPDCRKTKGLTVVVGSCIGPVQINNHKAVVVVNPKVRHSLQLQT